MKGRLLFLITEDWYFWSHRLPIAKAAKKSGLDVLVATRISQYKERIEAEGFKLIPISLERKSKNILKEIASIFELAKIYRKEKPDIVHHVAVKPILYGSLAAWICGIPCVVNAVAGLGFIFVGRGLKVLILRNFITIWYRVSFALSKAFGIFQNPDDLQFFVNSKIVKKEKAFLIRGSGVDTSCFDYSAESGGTPVIVLASRMLWNKGVGDFVEAAKILKEQGVSCRMVLVGEPDLENPAFVPEKDLKDWHASGIIEWWGRREDMLKVFAQAHIVALPTTYGEGVPKVLIEAAACGRAIVATDVPGCREIVRHENNGLLIPVNNPKALASAIKVLIENPGLRAKMGLRGHAIVKAEFSQEQVVEETLAVYKKILEG